MRIAGVADSSVRLPGPDDDATPFLLRCRVRQTPFRPVHEFDPVSDRDEFKLYLWRSASLRDVASMLHMRDPAISTPMSLHTFRVVYFDARRDVWAARDVKGKVTRLSQGSFNDALDGVISADKEEEDPAHSQIFNKTVDRVKPRVPSDADEDAAKISLDELGFTEGGVLECTISRPPASFAPQARGGRRMRIDSSGADSSQGWSRNRAPF